MTSGRNEEFYEGDRDQVLSTAGIGETMQEVLARRWSRRGLVKGGLAAGLVLTAAGRDLRGAGAQDATPVAGEAARTGGLTFVPITLDAGDDIVVAAGHTAVPFLRWGDPIMAGAPEWDLDEPDRPRRRSSSSATTATGSASSRCRRARTAPTTGCSSSTTSTPTPS